MADIATFFSYVDQWLYAHDYHAVLATDVNDGHRFAADLQEVMASQCALTKFDCGLRYAETVLSRWSEIDDWPEDIARQYLEQCGLKQLMQ